MPGDNPFAEPSDFDRTIRPRPGGGRPAPAATPAPPIPPAKSAPLAGEAPVPDAGAVGDTPLAVAAAPLLQLLGRLRNTLTQPDPMALRDRAVHQLQQFEARARDGGVPGEQIRPAHYALCASIDDVVLATPWGRHGGWGAKSLTATFHHDDEGGTRFFEILDQVRQTPAKLLPVLDLIYVCLSLGVQGRYRVAPNGAAQVEDLRKDLYATIRRQRPAMETTLSARSRGVSAPYRPAHARLPVWVAAAAGVAAVCGVFAWFSFGLSAASDSVFAQMTQAPPAQMPRIVRAAPAQPPPPVPAPAEPALLDGLRGVLQSEIARGLVVVTGTDAMPVLRISDHTLFGGAAAAVVQGTAIDLLERIGRALKGERGPVRVIGYSDNQPVHTIKYPSAFDLSTARARAVAEIIARGAGGSARIASEGRASADPIASNATAQGRDENRRIDVVLRPER